MARSFVGCSISCGLEVLRYYEPTQQDKWKNTVQSNAAYPMPQTYALETRFIPCMVIIGGLCDFVHILHLDPGWRWVAGTHRKRKLKLWMSILPRSPDASPDHWTLQKACATGDKMFAQRQWKFPVSKHRNLINGICASPNGVSRKIICKWNTISNYRQDFVWIG